jgi:hypothetical protein
MIQQQWQIAIDTIEQFSGTATGDRYEDIEWGNAPIDEDVLTAVYNDEKRVFWVPDAIQKRDQLLAESDWTQNRDVSLSNNSDWVLYRQKLRDITINFDPVVDTIIWPTKPE